MRRALIVAFAAALVIAPTAGAWTWPVQGPILQKFVLGDDRLGLAARKADARLRSTGAAVGKGREIAARRVEHSDRAAQDVLNERVFGRQGPEREAGVVESFE